VRSPASVVAFVVSVVPVLVAAQQPAKEAVAPSEAAAPDDAVSPEVEAFVAGLEKVRSLPTKTGTVAIEGGNATMTLPDGYHYLAKTEAQFWLSEIWGNPKLDSVLGLVLPSTPLEALDAEDSEGFGIVLRYDDMGHVDDDDAADADYAAILTDMQKDTVEANAQRKAAGFPEVQLLGWAEPPRYDAAAKKIYWAKRLKFDGHDAEQLNYDVRILGRKGVLVMSAVADATALTRVTEAARALLDKTEFDAGHRYADFDSKLDTVAAVGVGGLVAGKALAKAGVLKALAKPLLLVGAAVVSLVAKLFGKKSEPPAA